MRSRAILICLLVGVVGWLVLTSLTRSPSRLECVGNGSIALVQSAIRKPDGVPAQANVAERPFQEPFRWSQLENHDLQLYLSRLRASGCPETTIQDIIIGIINRRYAPQFATLTRKATTPFWHTLERRRPRQESESAQREAARLDLRREYAAVVNDLLGVDIHRHHAALAEMPDRLTGFLDGMGESVCPEARRVLERYDLLERAVASPVGGTLGVSEQAELQQLYRQKLAELAGVLDAEELREFELRASPLSHRMRTADLVGFSPSEDEFRALFDLKQAWEKQSESGEGHSEAEPKRFGESQLRAVLGDKRYADYTRAQDLTFRRLVEFAGHYGLSADTAAQVHDLREAVIQQADRLHADPRLDGAIRETALREIQAEAVEAVRESLGEGVYHRYLQTHYGRWLDLIPTWTNGVVLRN